MHTYKRSAKYLANNGLYTVGVSSHCVIMESILDHKNLKKIYVWSYLS